MLVLSLGWVYFRNQLYKFTSTNIDFILFCYLLILISELCIFFWPFFVIFEINSHFYLKNKYNNINKINYINFFKKAFFSLLKTKEFKLFFYFFFALCKIDHDHISIICIYLYRICVINDVDLKKEKKEDKKYIYIYIHVRIYYMFFKFFALIKWK
jgi:hypothetical protein